MVKITKVVASYFSATGTTKTVVEAMANTVAETIGVPCEVRSFTLPAGRKEPLTFVAGELVFLGTPVYAGRVPNVLLKYIKTMTGAGALGVPVVVYGNRNYDDALIELRDLMETAGIHTIAGAAFIGEHSFSKILAAGRPDEKDVAKAKKFAGEVAAKLTGDMKAEPIAVKGNEPYRPYYVPKMKDGSNKNIIKVFPKVDKDKCINCLHCVKICPLGSINAEDVATYTGICIKCGACVKGCPKGARYYDDPVYEYHKTNLEENFMRRAEPEMFI